MICEGGGGRAGKKGCFVTSSGKILISSLSRRDERGTVVFLSCPLVKKHADLSGSFLYSQSTMKDNYVQ